MISQKNISILDYTYSLPNDRIAKYPLSKRDESKLLIYKNGDITTDQYKNLDSHLPENTLLVFNNTKVVEARILFEKSTGSTIELFCLEPSEIYPDITTAMLQKGKVLWKCLVGGAKKWKEPFLEKNITDGPNNLVLTATKKEKFSDYFLIEFSWNDETLSFAEVLHIAGLIPLPPYIHRVAEESDKDRYQTIYARHDGSVAAPTAGLHFTPELFEKLHAKNIKDSYTTLHVGAGTFKPVKAETMAEHEMHAEFIDVSLSFIERLINQSSSPIVAVGTTSLRTIESLYWLGVKTILHPDISLEQLHLSQWEVYEIDSRDATHRVSTKDALVNLSNWMKQHQLERLITKTQIIIAPGYQLKVANGLITNFHQPQSTLLLLVSAIIGDNWKTVYQYAMDNDFRFLSYGDGCLLWHVI